MNGRVVVRRIHEVEVKGFRGFVGAGRRIRTDADIVLLAGGNGFGKTSLLQALTLLLTGHPELESEKLWSRIRRKEGEHGAQDIEIEARGEVEVEEEAGETTKDVVALRVVWPCEGEAKPEFSAMLQRSGGAFSWPRTLQPVFLREGESREQFERRKEDARKTLARVTSFYPERVEQVFESVITGSTLRDVFNPMPEPVAVALRRLDHLQEEMKKWLEDVRSARGVPEKLARKLEVSRSDFLVCWKNLKGILEEVVAATAEGRAFIEQLIGADPTLDHLERVLREQKEGSAVERGAGGKGLLKALEEVLEAEIEHAQREARQVVGAERLLNERKAINEDLGEIERVFSDLDAELACFAGDAGSGVGLLGVLRAVAEGVEEWCSRASRLKKEERQKIASVLRELEAVVPQNARAVAQELEDWLRPREQAKERRALLWARRDEIERMLEGYRHSVRLTALREAKRAISALEMRFARTWQELYRAERCFELQGQLEEAGDELEQLVKQLEATAEGLREATEAKEDILKHTAELAERVLGRFALVEGILRLQLRDTEGERTIQTASGLSLLQLSSGQKAQMAISLAVAQSELLRVAEGVDLPFRVLLLDDVSTAYDLVNVAREAVLWRQLAYNERDEERWQLFITSHREDLTMQLLDLLVPPYGRSLRLLRFKGWTKEEGPLIEEFSLEPSRALDVELRGYIEQAIKETVWKVS